MTRNRMRPCKSYENHCSPGGHFGAWKWIQSALLFIGLVRNGENSASCKFTTRKKTDKFPVKIQVSHKQLHGCIDMNWGRPRGSGVALQCVQIMKMEKFADNDFKRFYYAESRIWRRWSGPGFEAVLQDSETLLKIKEVRQIDGESGSRSLLNQE